MLDPKPEKPSDTKLTVVPESGLTDSYDVEIVREPAQPPSRVLRWIGKSILALLQAVLSIAILAGAYMVAQRLIEQAPEARKRPAFKTVYTVETVDAVVADNQPTFTVYGQTAAARTVDLRALVAGEIIAINDNLRAGNRVEQGAVLVGIDRFAYEGALAEANSNLAESRARISENTALIAAEEDKREPLAEQLALARADLDRMTQLQNNGSGTQQQLEARSLVVSQRQAALDQIDNAVAVQRSRLAQLEASLERLQWRVEQAQRNLTSTELTAPFSGIVRESSAEIGRNVSANDVVVSLYAADSLEVRFTLSDAQYGRLASSETGLIGREVEAIWTVGGRDYTFPGTIDRLGADIASNRGGVEVFARLDQSTADITLRPGAFVEVSVPDRVFSGTIAIPDTAVYGTDRVYTEVDGVLIENIVEIAVYDGDKALVSSGLNEGDKVLTTRITEVSPGLSVRREGDPAPERGDGAGGSATGRPSPEEIAKIVEVNGLTQEQFRALEQNERRALIRAYRESQPREPVDAATDGGDN